MPAQVYATAADLLERFGADEVGSLAVDDDPILAAVTVSRALSDASEEAASYVSAQYLPPYPTVPRPLISAVCDVARFRLYKDRPTDNVKYRYEKAVEWFKQIAAGKARLQFDPPLEVDDALAVYIAPAVGQAAVDGLFGEVTLDRMPGIYPTPYLWPRRSGW